MEKSRTSPYKKHNLSITVLRRVPPKTRLFCEVLRRITQLTTAFVINYL